jgi:quinol monooxygenase YgiN
MQNIRLMVIITKRAIVDSNHQREFLQTAMALLNEFRKEKGCIRYHIYEDMEYRDVFVIFAEWETMDDLERHFKTRNYRILFGAIHSLGKNPEVWIRVISSTTGIEAIKKLEKKQIK